MGIPVKVEATRTPFLPEEWVRVPSTEMEADALNHFTILLLNLNSLTRFLTRPPVWRYARACFSALDLLAQHVCGQIALHLKTHHAYFSRGVQN